MRTSLIIALCALIPLLAHADEPAKAADPAMPAKAGATAEPAAADTAAAEPAPAPDPEAELRAKVQTLLDEADKLYAQRAASGKAEASIEKAREVLKLDPKSYEAQWRVARGAYWLADGTNDAKVKAKWGKVGWDAGVAGLEVRPGAIEAQFWGAASLGMYAKGVGIMKAFWDGLGKQYEQWVRKAMEINPKYAWGGPPRALGRYFFTIPGIAGGDNSKAIKYLEESKRLAPDALRTRAWLGEVYLDEGQKDKAKAELDYCLNADPKKGDFPDNSRMRLECERLAKKL